MEMSEAVYRALSGGRSPATELRGLGVPELVRAVESASGSQRAAAARLGVSPSTLRRWKAGSHRPRGLAGLQAAAKAALRRGRMGPRREAKLRGLGPWSITGVVVISADTRRRTVQPGRELPEGHLSPAVDAYLRADDLGAAEVVERAIDQFIPGMHLVDVEAIRLGP